MAQESTLLHNICPEQLFNKLKELIIELLEKKTITQQVKSVTEELMTPKEVALYFKRHKDTIQNWTNNGFLIKYSLGMAVYYKRSEVESAMKPL